MGASATKGVREAPVRYVARQLPRLESTPIEQQFKKPNFTAQGINTRREDVNTEPQMYVETSQESSSTEVTDHTAPRWYLNTYMEMVDNLRTDQVIISGNLPMSWERDKFEPYSLVQGRIDDEDLKWVLDPEQRKKGVEGLVEHTKLPREVLQDILDTVELPRVQYRNYKGKLHKSIENSNTYMEARKQQLEKARESEILRQIGYTEEEVEREEQYLTNRTRGVKALDSLGASQREKRRMERAVETSELEDMLEERRVEQLERGEYHLTERDIHEKPDKLSLRPKFQTSFRSGGGKKMYAGDFGKDKNDYAKFHWWLDRSRRVKRAVDTIHGVPIYNERLSANEEQNRKQMEEAAAFNFSLSMSQGAKGFTDPRGHYDQFIEMVREHKKEEDKKSPSLHLYEDGVSEHDVFRFPHTKHHSPRPSSVTGPERHDKATPLDTNIHRYHDNDNDDDLSSSSGDGSSASPQRTSAEGERMKSTTEPSSHERRSSPARDREGGGEDHRKNSTSSSSSSSTPHPSSSSGREE